MEDIVIDFLYPIELAIKPNNSVPAIDPNEIKEPIQPASSFVMGPPDRGVASEKSNGNAGDSHPILQPTANVITLPAKKL